jgi:thiamine biosynthesis lipoprotein
MKRTQTKEYFNYFDTFSSLRIDNVTEEDFSVAADELDKLLYDYDALLDIYDSHKDVTSLFDVNANAGGGATKVDKRLFDAISFGIEAHGLTNGYCNIALGSVISLWHAEREAARRDPNSAKLPDSDLIAEALTHTDISGVLLDKEELTVEITDPLLALDLGAIAKGYVGERACELLESLGHESFLLNLGGNVLARGKSYKNAYWSAAIEDPFGDKTKVDLPTVSLNAQTLVTSGSYQRFYTVGGKNYSHIVSHKDGMPPEQFVSVSVIASYMSSGIADALSTALFCMPFEEGRALIDSLDGIEAFWILPDGYAFASEGFGGTK